MRIKITSSLLLCWTILAASAVASLLQQIDDCESQVSLFKEGKTYYYTYDLENVAVNVKNEERFLLDIKCDVQLDAIGKCQYVLKTKDCRLFKEHNVLHDQSRSFSKQMEKNPVLVTMSQDNVNSISANEDEDKALLNIKRGIIGTFQTVHVNQLTDKLPTSSNRNSLQGICYVHFQLESQRTVKTEKSLSTCTLSDAHLDDENADLESYIVNEECRHHFNDVNDIYNVSCVEHSYFIGFDNYRMTAFFPRFRRSLNLVKSTSLVEQTESNLINYRVTNINYENQDPPKRNPPNLRRAVITLIERMVELSNSPIESESFWLFNDLVDTLRSSVSLDVLSGGIVDCWGSPKCQSAETPSADRNRIHFGHIWRDALIQCGSTACMKAFKSYVTQRTASMADVLRDEIMEDIYHEWLVESSTDLEFIYLIDEICKYRNQTLCYLALSSKIHRYWKLYSNLPIPKKLKVIVEKTIEPIKYCENATAANLVLLLSLKMLSNIGEFAEVVEPDLTDLLYQCASKSTTNGLISPVAVEAFRRMQPSSKLYEHLLNIIRNPSLEQEGRVNAYLILVDKWSEKAADDIDFILKSEAVDDKIKTFIYSHIKAVLRAQDHVRIRLAEAFRKIVDNNTLEYFLYNADEKLVSKYMESGLFFVSPFTDGKESLHGYQWTGTNLYDGTSFLPSSLMNKLKLTLAGEELDLQEVSIYSKGLMNSLTLFLRNISQDPYGGADSVSHLMSSLTSQLNNSESDFLFDKFDQRIVQKFKSIINKLSKSFNAKPSVLINSKTLGEESEYAALSEILYVLQRSLKDQSDKSTYRKNVELYKNSMTLVTSGGLPLKFFNDIELMVVTNSKFYERESNEAETSVVGFNSNIYSSFAIVAETGSIVEIPGFIRKGYGDEYFAAVSGSVVADVSLDMSEGGKKTVRLELPANSKQSVVFSKQYMAIEGKKRQLAFANKEKETNCYDLVRICQTRLLEEGAFLPQFYYKWELQTPEKHPAIFLFKYSTEVKETKCSTHLSLSASSERAKTFGQLLYYKYVLDKSNQIQRVNIGSDLLPNFKLEATFKNLHSDETKIQYRGSFTPDFGFDYISETTGLRYAEELFILPNFPDAKERQYKNVLGRFFIQNFVLLTPKGNLSIGYIKQQFPISSEYDLLLNFKCINTDAANWLRDIIQMPAVWEDSQTVTMTVHHGTESFLDNFVTGVPEDKTYTVLRFPKYKIELDSQSSIVEEHSVLSTLNLTSHSLPENNPQSSYKLSLHQTNVKDDSGVSTNKILATFSVPHLKWIFSLDHIEGNKNRGIVLKVQRRVNKDDDDSGHLNKSGHFSTISNLPPSIQEMGFDFVIVQNELDDVAYILSNFNYTGLPWLKTKSDPIGNIQFKFETHVPERIYNNDPINKHVTYSLRSNHYNRALYGEYLAGVDLYHKLNVVDHSNTTVCQLVISYPNNDIVITSPSISKRDRYDFTFNFSSDVYTQISQLRFIISESFPELTIIFSVVAHSPEWNILNIDLKQCIDVRNETLKTKHELMDIEGEGTWDFKSMLNYNSFLMYKKFLKFKSKTDWVPTMRWKLNCESIHKCVAQGTFAKTKTSPLFIVYELSPGKTELAFTICRNRICRDIVTDPHDFVLKAVFGLIEPFTVVQTITIDDRLIRQFEATLSRTFRKLFRNVEGILLNSNHPIHKIYEHFVGISIEETFTKLEDAGYEMIELLSPDARVTIGPVISGIIYASGPVSRVIRKISPTTLEIYSQSHWLALIYPGTYQVFRQRPGPYPGYSSVIDLHLPLALKPTTSSSSMRWNPKLFNYWNKLREDKHVFHDIFYDENYSRVALLIGNHAVRPFEGGLIKIQQPHCPQLLIYDVEEQLFIVYKQDDWLHIVLSDAHLEISYTKGQLIVNASFHEFPFAHWTGDFSVIREGDLVIVTTAYNLKIICDVGDHYCVFYTDIFWKFGKLYGLLGNNTDAVHAQQLKYSAEHNFNLFTLTDPSHCTKTNSHGFTGWPDYYGCEAFDNWHPRYPTFICHDKIDPAPYFEVCREQGRRPVTLAYLAACGALHVPVHLGNHWDFPAKCDGDHDIYSTWREFWDRQLVDVVFIVDKSLDPTYWESYSKGLTNLAVHIKNEFKRNSYSDINFALFGLRGSESLAFPTLYTTKSQIWGSAEDFSSSALRHLFEKKPSYKSNKGSGDLFDAIWLAMDTTPFASQAARIIVLVTPQDPFDRTEVEYLYGLLETLNSRQTTLYTISHYNELPKDAFGIVGNQLSKPKDLKTRIPTPPSGFKDLVQGHAARLALATKGALWSLSHLESGYDENQKEFLSEVSGAMLNRAQQFLNRYCQCSCNAPEFLKPYSSCEFV